MTLYCIFFVGAIMVSQSHSPEVRSKPIFVQEIAFAGMHLLPFGALFTGATWFDWGCALSFMSPACFG